MAALTPEQREVHEFVLEARALGFKTPRELFGALCGNREWDTFMIGEFLGVCEALCGTNDYVELLNILHNRRLWPDGD